MVQMNNVTKVYDSSNTVALDYVDLTINEGVVFWSAPPAQARRRL